MDSINTLDVGFMQRAELVKHLSQAQETHPGDASFYSDLLTTVEETTFSGSLGGFKSVTVKHKTK